MEFVFSYISKCSSRQLLQWCHSSSVMPIFIVGLEVKAQKESTHFSQFYICLGNIRRVFYAFV